MPRTHSFVLSAILCAFTLILLPAVSLGEANGAEDVTNDIEDLKKKLKNLEDEQAELYHSLEEKKEAGLATEVGEWLTIGGLIEVEAFSDDDEVHGDEVSDITLATMELAIGAELSEKVGAHVLLLWEEDDTEPVDLDEGYITLLLTDDVTLTLGKMYLPFGNFESHFISDPQTLELGEMRESAALISYGSELFEVSIGVFNGEADEAGEDEVSNFVGSIKGKPHEKITIGASYTCNLADTDALIAGTTIDEKVVGYGAFITVEHGPISFNGEVLAAADDFEPVDLDGDGDGEGDKPSTFNVELAYDINERTELAVRYEGNSELFELPETQYGASVSYGLYKSVSLALEYLHGEYDTDEERSLIAGQVALEF